MSQNKLFNVYIFNEIESRGVINGKAGKAAALHNFSDMLTLSQPRGADYAHPLVLPCLKKSVIMPLLRPTSHAAANKKSLKTGIAF